MNLKPITKSQYLNSYSFHKKDYWKRMLNNKFDIGIKEIRKIVDQIKETQKQDLQENLLTEPPDTDNEDPLTPLDQKYVTFEKLQENYKLFVNRVQQQLASFGGGGERSAACDLGWRAVHSPQSRYRYHQSTRLLVGPGLSVRGMEPDHLD